MCEISGINAEGANVCKFQRAKGNQESFCRQDTDKENCGRYQTFKKLDEQGFKQYEADKKHGQEKVNSLVFNAFIFMQVSLMQ